MLELTLPANRSCTIVVAEYDSPRDANLVRQWAPPGCLVHVYSKKRGGCSQLGSNGPAFVCEELPNVGRDLGTYLLHVSRHYASLPDRLHFVPAVLRKYNRGGMLQAFLKATRQPFLCVTSHKNRRGVAADLFRPPSGRVHTFDDPRGCYANTGNGVPCLEFEMPLYKELRVARTVYPLHAFVEQHLGPWVSPEDLASSVVCLNGVFSTTRRNLLRYPRHVYDALRNQTDVADASEAVHMVERLAQVVFGAATMRGGRVTVRNETSFQLGR